jgi:hypothetical protein
MTVRYTVVVSWLDLRPFAPGPPAVAVSARASRSAGVLTLDYRLDDPWDAVRLPAASASPARSDRLWEHTCFEAFVAPAGAAPYWEVNLASGGDWNVWRFDDYRRGMAPEDAVDSARVESSTGTGTLRLTATIDLSPVEAIRTAALAVGLAVVVETTDGTLSYWAAVHPGKRPDFHARDGFSLRLTEARP